MTDNRSRIKLALQSLQGDGFGDRAVGLLNILGYHSTRVVDEAPMQPEEFVEMYTAKSAKSESTKSEDVFVSEARSVQVLFQVTDSEMGGQTRLDATSYDKSMNKSFLFVAVELKRITYPRGRYAAFTREINKRLKIPAVILFRTPDSKCTLGFIHRREGIRDPGHHVLERVSLVREISSLNPHRAHVDILHSLSMLERLGWIVNNRKRRNFDGLHDAWLAALDTEELNKRFYRDLYDWFERAAVQASLPKNIRPQEHMLRLITRLLFVWFVKQKELVNNCLFNERYVKDILVRYDSGGDSYYRAILQNLFFATLNTEIGRRGFGDTNTSYHYKHEIKDIEALLELFNQTPFINGGLFDCMDEEDNRTDYFVDDISERHGYSIPNRLFFEDGHNPGLITILNKYHFTVEESTPLEQEVALDPELLGKVFENLLAAYNPETWGTVRKQTGSYYTPREVVDYIVDKTLAASLAGKICNSAESAEVVKEKMQKLLDYSTIPNDLELTDEERDDIVRAISEIKILDPAVGSGAFPMSVLHKLTLILNRIDPENKIWMKLQTDTAKRRASEIFEKVDTCQREEQLQQTNTIFERYSDDFGRKLYLIQNNIYGVDIQSIAIQITKLRFFISLAIEQDMDNTNPDDNYGVQPLPNLETRFVAANTLVPLNKSAQQTIGQTDDDVKRLESDLIDNREQYFLASRPETKSRCRDNDARLRNQLANAVNKAGDAGYVDKMAKWDPYDQNHISDWFDSKYMFGIPNGFDCVIGNPPYRRQEAITGKQHMQLPVPNSLELQDHTISSKADLYVYFFYHSLNILRNDGYLGFITSDSWLFVNYAGNVQRTFLSYSRIISLERPDSAVFADPDVRTVMMFLERTDEIPSGHMVRFASGPDYKPLLIRQADIKPGRWLEYFGDVLLKTDRKMVSLQQVSRVWRGTTTGHDNFFILDMKTVQKYGIDDKYLTATLKKNVAGVVLRHATTHYLLTVSDSKGVLSGAPDGKPVMEYLKLGDGKVYPKKGKDIKQTRIRHLKSVKAHKPYWYTLRMPNPPPIIISRIVDRRLKAYENQGEFVPKDNFACVRPNNNAHTNALLAYMSSSWFALQAERIGRAAGGGALQLVITDFKQMPVPDLAKIDLTLLDNAWLKYRENLDLEQLDATVFAFLGFGKDQAKAIQTKLVETIDRRRAAAKP